MMAFDSADVLKMAGERACRDSDFLGYLLRIHREHEHLTENQLAEALDVNPELLPRLYLCRRPDSTRADFSERIRIIADYALVDSGVLAAIVRSVEAVESLSENRAAQILAAARDRDVPETNEPPKSEIDDSEHS